MARSKGADDGDGDWTEYSITPYAANATEQVTFQTTTQSQYVMTAVALRPR